MNNLPAGYALTITTWENDADNYSDGTLYGLSVADVKFYLSVLNKFLPSSREGYGNNEYSREIELRVIEEAFVQSPPDSIKLVSEIREILTDYREDPEFIVNVLGTWGHDYGSSLWRVFDSFQVHLISEECINCTSEFE